MPETVGHNVWSKEKKGSRDSGSTILKTKLRVYNSRVLHRIKLGAGCGRTARAEGRQPTHGSVC